MKKRNLQCIIALLCGFVAASGFGGDDRVVAVVAGRAITADAFLRRYESAVWRNKHIKSWQDILKQQVLLAMIAEQLLAEDGQKTGLADDVEILRLTHSLQDALVRDRLYQDEIKSKVTITPAEIKQAYEWYAAPRIVQMARFTTLAEAEAIQKDLAAGAPFDSLANFLPDNQFKHFSIKWGESPAYVDSLLFNMQPGQTVGPFVWDQMFYFARLESILKPAIYDQQDFINQRTRLKQILQDRREQHRLREFIPTIMHGQTATIKKDALLPFIESVSVIMAAAADSIIKPDQPWSFTFEDLATLQQRLGENVNRQMVVLNDRQWTLADLLDRLTIKGLALIPAKPIAPQLISLIEDHIDSHWLTEEAYRRGLDQHPQVQADLAQWQRFYTANLNALLWEAEADTQQTTVFLLNVREILSPDAVRADSIWRQLQAGADFVELARRFTIRPGYDENAGELGFFDPAYQFREIGQIALNLKPGERHPPAQVSDGWSIIELIAKKLPPQAALAAFRGQAGANSDSLLNQRLAELARQANLSLDFNLLRELKVTSINMFTVRQLGFGGAIPAMPQLPPRFDWYRLFTHPSP